MAKRRWFKRGNEKQKLVSDVATVKRYKSNDSVRRRQDEWSERLPLFTYDVIATMQRDPKVAFAFSVATNPMRVAEFEVSGDNSIVEEFVASQLNDLWAVGFDQIADTFAYGWGGYEVMYRYADSGDNAGRIVFDHLVDFHPHDVKPIHLCQKLIGITISGATTRGKENQFRGKAALWNMKKLWLANQPKYRSFFGDSILRPAFPPWVEKHAATGAVALRRLRFFKDAYVGDVIYYPFGRIFTQPDGDDIAAADIAREAVEERSSGSVMALPSNTYAENGQKMFEYNPPQHIPGGEDMIAYVEQLDKEIFEGMGLPTEIVTASATGSGYSGRSIPFLVFLTQRESMAEAIVRQLDEQIIRPLVTMNFGIKEPDYAVTMKPLIETIGAQMGEGGMDSQLAGPAASGTMPGILPMDTVAMSTLFDDETDEGAKREAAGSRIARRMQKQLIAAGGKKKQPRASIAAS